MYENATIIGSGTVPSLVDTFPGLSSAFPPGTFPTPPIASDGRLHGRLGQATVLINPEDLSAFIGLRHSAITVAGTAINITPSPLEFRRALLIHNNGPAAIYIGASGVTVNDGMPIAVNEKIAFDVQGTTRIWAISNSSVDVRIIEIS